MCPRTFSKVHRKTPALESIFNKIAGLQPLNLFERDSGTGVCLGVYEVLENVFLTVPLSDCL